MKIELIRLHIHSLNEKIYFFIHISLTDPYMVSAIVDTLHGTLYFGDLG